MAKHQLQLAALKDARDEGGVKNTRNEARIEDRLRGLQRREEEYRTDALRLVILEITVRIFNFNCMNVCMYEIDGVT